MVVKKLLEQKKEAGAEPAAALAAAAASASTALCLKETSYTACENLTKRKLEGSDLWSSGILGGMLLGFS